MATTFRVHLNEFTCIECLRVPYRAEGDGLPTIIVDRNTGTVQEGNDRRQIGGITAEGVFQHVRTRGIPGCNPQQRYNRLMLERDPANGVFGWFRARSAE